MSYLGGGKLSFRAQYERVKFDMGSYTNHVATKGGGRGYLKKPQHYITAI